MSVKDLIEDFQEWFATVPPEFLFMLLLPFAVAVAGLAAWRMGLPGQSAGGEQAGTRSSRPSSAAV